MGGAAVRCAQSLLTEALTEWMESGDVLREGWCNLTNKYGETLLQPVDEAARPDQTKPNRVLVSASACSPRSD